MGSAQDGIGPHPREGRRVGGAGLAVDPVGAPANRAPDARRPLGALRPQLFHALRLRELRGRALPPDDAPPRTGASATPQTSSNAMPTGGLHVLFT